MIQVCLNDDPRLTFDLFYGKVKFASLCICMGNKLKIQFLKMYYRPMAETYNVDQSNKPF